MRTWFNSIFVVIGAASLTDEEFDAIDLTGITVNVYNQAAYDALAAVLTSRESVSDLHDRLFAWFRVQGVVVSAATTGKSNIYVGSVLD